MRQRIPLGPLDKEGLRFDRPTNQVRWSELTNVIIKEGKFVTRPGFQEPGGAGSRQLPSVQPQATTAIYEIFNPGSSITGRESFTPATDLLTPDGSSDLVAGWSGDHTDIDEGTPNGSDVMSTSTAGAQKSLSFSAQSTTYDQVFGVNFHVRARVDKSGGWAKLNFYFRGGTTNKLVHSHVVTASDESSEGPVDDWEDIFFSVSRDLVNDEPLTNADITALTLVIELDSSGTILTEGLLPSSDGTHTGWDDNEDGGSGTVDDYAQYPSLGMGGPDEGLNYVTSSTKNDKQSYSTETPTNTFTSIDYVTLAVVARAPVRTGLKAFIVGSDGQQYTLTNATYSNGVWPVGGGFWGTGYHTLQSFTNPETETSWADVDLDNVEFGFENAGGETIVVLGSNVWVRGSVSGGVTVEIDTVNAAVIGSEFSQAVAGLDKARLWSSPGYHMRRDSDDKRATITDVTNSVPLDSTGPGWPVHHAVLYGQAYLVNGVDPTVRYPNGSNVFAELSTNNADGSTPITGRCVAAFGDRIIYGWVKDNTTVTPERVAYSKFQDGGTHNDTSAGDFDLLDTPGGVMALVPIDEVNMAAIKEVGCYTIRRTGQVRIPFIRDVIDFQTGCIASKTAIRAQSSEGAPMVLFLGRSPTNGINVYAFDGAKVTVVGQPISRKLQEDMNHAASYLSHAALDPQSGTYWLFVPEGNQMLPKQAWVMSLQSGQWTRAEFPFEVSASGNWHTISRSVVGGANVDIVGGSPTLMIGASSLPYAALSDVAADELSNPTSTVFGGTSEDVFGDLQNTGTGRAKEPVVARIATGDMVKPAGFDAMAYTLELLYETRAPSVQVEIESSEDGGLTWTAHDELPRFLGADNTTTDSDNPMNLGQVRYVALDMKPSHASSIRYRLTFRAHRLYSESTLTTEEDLQTFGIPPLFEIYDLWLSYEDGSPNE